MKFKLNVLAFFLISICFQSHQTLVQDPTSHKYKAAELQSDFKFLRKKLEYNHPNLYLYTPKTAFDALFDSIYNSIGDNTQIEFFNKICRLNSSIKDGHTYFLPALEYRNFTDANNKFLPLDLYIIDDKLFLLHNYSDDPNIIAGSEIISLNNIKAGIIINQLMDQQVRDGYSLTYPRWILNNYFRSYYSYSFGTPDVFNIKLKLNNEVINKQINGLPRKTIAENKMKSQGNISNKGNGIVLEIDEQYSRRAKLTIKTFDNKLLKNTYGQEFKKSINAAFDKIIANKIGTLTIDLKDNQGGDVKNASLLCSYLIDIPFKVVLKGPKSAWTKPQKDRYTNKLFILINGGSFSATGMTAAALRLNKKGIFIGEETGGNKVILSGNAWSCKLPNTKIECHISHRTYLLNDGKNDGHGVIPDYELLNTVKDILNDTNQEAEVIRHLLNE